MRHKFIMLSVPTTVAVAVVFGAIAFHAGDVDAQQQKQEQKDRAPKAQALIKGELNVPKLDLVFVRGALNVPINIPPFRVPFDFDPQRLAKDDEYEIVQSFNYGGTNVRVTIGVVPPGPDVLVRGGDEIRLATEVLRVVGPMVFGGGEGATAELSEGRVNMTVTLGEQQWDRVLGDLLATVEFVPQQD